MKKQTLVVDLESMSNVPQYQKDVFNKLSAGIAAGAMNVISVGRQTGKSVYTQMLKTWYYSTNLCKEIAPPPPKYKFSRAKWYTVSFWDFFRDDSRDGEIIKWCVDTFGPVPKNPDAWTRWHYQFTTLYFRDEADYLMYQLRWA